MGTSTLYGVSVIIYNVYFGIQEEYVSEWKVGLYINMNAVCDSLLSNGLRFLPLHPPPPRPHNCVRRVKLYSLEKNITY